MYKIFQKVRDFTLIGLGGFLIGSGISNILGGQDIFADICIIIMGIGVAFIGLL